MGPRLFSRGRVPAFHACGIWIVKLQWGRGCSAAEGSGALLDAMEFHTLQWGRGCSAAEGSQGNANSTLLRCFNGAAAVQPRKGSGSGAVSLNFTGLQWGRGCSAAEGVGQIGHSARNGC